MHIVVLGSKSGNQVREIIKSRHDDVNVTVYSSIGEFMTASSVRTVEIDRFLIIQDALPKDNSFYTVLTNFYMYVNNHYPASRVVSLVTNFELKKELDDIFISPFMVTAFEKSINPKIIMGLATQPIDVLHRVYTEKEEVQQEEDEIDLQEYGTNNTQQGLPAEGVVEGDPNLMNPQQPLPIPKKRGLFGGIFGRSKKNKAVQLKDSKYQPLNVPEYTQDNEEQPQEDYEIDEVDLIRQYADRPTVEGTVYTEDGYDTEQNGNDTLYEEQENSDTLYEEQENNDIDFDFHNEGLDEITENIDPTLYDEGTEEIPSYYDETETTSSEENYDPFAEVNTVSNDEESYLEELVEEVVNDEHLLDVQEDEIVESTPYESKVKRIEEITDREIYRPSISDVIGTTDLDIEILVSEEDDFNINLQEMQSEYKKASNEVQVVEREVLVEKEVIVEKVIEVTQAGGMRVKKQNTITVITGDRKTGVTQTALNMAKLYTEKNERTLYVDFDLLRKGSLMYLGIEDVSSESETISNGLYEIKTPQSIRNMTYFFSKGKFDCLLSTFMDNDNTRLKHTINVLMTQTTYKNIVIDCPLDSIYLLEDLLITSNIIFCITNEADVVYKTLVEMGQLKFDNRIKSSVFINGRYLLLNDNNILLLKKRLKYYEELFGLDEEVVNWTEMNIIGSIDKLHLILEEL